MPFQEDMPAFFGDFADAGTLAGRAAVGIYSENASTLELGGMPVQHAGPVYLMTAADVLTTDDGAALVIPQGSFTVRRIEPTDDGLALLLLEVAA